MLRGTRASTARTCCPASTTPNSRPSRRVDVAGQLDLVTNVVAQVEVGVRQQVTRCRRLASLPAFAFDQPLSVREDEPATPDVAPGSDAVSVATHPVTTSVRFDCRVVTRLETLSETAVSAPKPRRSAPRMPQPSPSMFLVMDDSRNSAVRGGHRTAGLRPRLQDVRQATRGQDLHGKTPPSTRASFRAWNGSRVSLSQS